jgi:hypothetical protein
MDTFIAYSVVEIVLQFGNFLFCLYQLFITFSKAKEGGWAKWSLVTGILVAIGFGCLIRVIIFAVDPHAVRGILPPVAEQVLFNFALILWIGSAFSLYLYWYDL